MKKHDFFLVLRSFIYIFEFFLLYSLEQNPGLNAEIYGVRPLVLVPFFVSAVVFESEIFSLGLGLVCGILLDVSFGTVPGCFMLILGLIGYFTGIMFKYFIRINLFSAMIFNFLILAVVCLLKIYFNYSKLGVQNNFYMWNNVFVPTVCCSGVLFVLAYFFNKYIYYKLSEKWG
ncbi:MAG: rod shape-determining protein MreD [Elusimicrobiaceae bacterium]|nr:rod shape-determining protein MreD [Elusimicrobiaceae bacterium]